MSSPDRDDVVVVDRGGGQIMAFFAGLALGAAAALLLAPQSGAETRQDIARYGKRARRAASRFTGDLRDRAEDAYDTARTEMRRRVRDAKRGVEETIDEVKLRVDAGREAGKAAAQAARDTLQRRLADADLTRDGDDA